MSTNAIKAVADFFDDYVSFEEKNTSTVLALWAALTHVADFFDAFPYLTINSFTKRSGKTRTAEMVSLISSNPQNSAGITPAAMFQIINPKYPAAAFKGAEHDRLPTISFDEAESLSSEAASTMRALLNVGYRKGQTIPRVGAGRTGVVHYNTYCPKVFVLIGDTYDTLKDRSIIVTMKRKEPKKRFSFDVVKPEGAALKSGLVEILKVNAAAIKSYYESERSEFLSDRDEEIWRPIFAGCLALYPEAYDAVQKLAVDMCAMKAGEKRRFSQLDIFETQAQNDEFAARLLEDCLLVIRPDENKIPTAELIDRLFALALAPWRKFKGSGLTDSNLADLLSRYEVRPRQMRSKGSSPFRGYECEAFRDAQREVQEAKDKEGEGEV